ncbi:MAG: nucleoside triphosphate pyrophosphatase [Vicinamibacterales bacterium]
MTDLILASASPRRAELLRAAGLSFDVVVADVDESIHPGESPETYVRRVAGAKARAVTQRMPGRRVLAADTTVVVDGEILAKPADANDAGRMLRRLSGRTHQVLTAVCLDGRCEVESTDVEFVELTEDEIAWYVASGEPMDKAGAYAIQGLASRFISRIRGSYSNVVGLPVARVYAMLRPS